MTTIIQTLGIASCLGGPLRPCGYAAELLRDAYARRTAPNGWPLLQWHMAYPDKHGSRESRLFRLNHNVAQFTRYWTQTCRPFLAAGGDHSCALGTWPGVMAGLPHNGALGLIWLDAHMDAHTFATTPSGNIHGMPVAALLGKADERLAAVYPGSRFIEPQNLILLGVRSYEAEEYALLTQAKVKIVFSGQITDFSQTLETALRQLSRTCQTIGISLDLDVIDPADAPGVETPAPGGIRADAVLAALAAIRRNPKLCGLEISEFNPDNDSNGKTLRLMQAVVEAFYGADSPNKSLG